MMHAAIEEGMILSLKLEDKIAPIARQAIRNGYFSDLNEFLLESIRIGSLSILEDMDRQLKSEEVL